MTTLNVLAMGKNYFLILHYYQTVDKPFRNSNMYLDDLISKLLNTWRFPSIYILVIFTYILPVMSNTWKLCLLVAMYYPSLYPFLFFLFLFLFLHLKLRIACPNSSELHQVLESRNEKICVGLTEKKKYETLWLLTPCSFSPFICNLCINTGQ